MRSGYDRPPVSDKLKRDIGNNGFWTLSSYKPGNGVEQLLDENLSTFWQ